MELTGDAYSLKIIVGEADRFHGQLLFEAIVYEAKKQGLAGATVNKGIMSYGANKAVHTTKIFALSADLPVTIEVIDKEEKIKEFTEKLKEVFKRSKCGGIVTLQKVEVLLYQKRG